MYICLIYSISRHAAIYIGVNLVYLDFRLSGGKGP